jgi:hypothetical protein
MSHLFNIDQILNERALVPESNRPLSIRSLKSNRKRK